MENEPLATVLSRLRASGGPAFFSLILCLCFPAVSILAQTAGSPDPPLTNTREASGLVRAGRISGTIIDPSGAAVSNARVQLTRGDQSQPQETLSGTEGQFSFADLAPGSFQLAIVAEGFVTQSLSGELHEGEDYAAERIGLVLAPERTDVQVVAPRIEVAEEQIREQEKQRVLGFLPNFYVSYVPDAAPLTTKQKFQLAWKSTFDPVNLVLTAAIAGIQQASNAYKEYGQGAQGYGKRYGADFADSVTTTFIGSAILPSIFRQDPRYFYKGAGSTRSRIFYAIEMAVVCKGDNGKLQANYSAILGSLATGGISNLYYPANDRNGAALTFESTAIGLGTTAAANVLQEFVIRRLTPPGRKRDKKADSSAGSQ